MSRGGGTPQADSASDRNASVTANFDIDNGYLRNELTQNTQISGT
jgi:hypothetical protein